MVSSAEPPESDVYALLEEGADRFGEFYKDLYRLEWSFSQAFAGCSGSIRGLTDAISCGLEIVEKSEALLLCFADLAEDELDRRMISEDFG